MNSLDERWWWAKQPVGTSITAVPLLSLKMNALHVGSLTLFNSGLGETIEQFGLFRPEKLQGFADSDERKDRWVPGFLI